MPARASARGMSRRRGTTPLRDTRGDGGRTNTPSRQPRRCAAPLGRFPGRGSGARRSVLTAMLGGMLDRQPMVGLAIAERVHALDDIQFLFLQVTHQFADEFSRRVTEAAQSRS